MNMQQRCFYTSSCSLFFFWLPTVDWKMFLAKKFLGGIVDVIGWEFAQFIFLQLNWLDVFLISVFIFVFFFFFFSNIDPSQFIQVDPVSILHPW